MAVSAAVFAAVLWFVDFRGLLALLAGAAPRWLAAAFAANLVYLYVVAQVLSALCGGTPGPLRVLRVNLISVYFGTFLPGDVAAGLVSRIRYLGLPSWQEVVNRTVVERLVSLATYSVIVAATLGFSQFWQALGPAALLVPAGVLAAVGAGLALARNPGPMLARMPWLQRRLAGLSPKIAIGAFRASPHVFVLSAVSQLAMSVVPFALLRSLGAEVSYVDAIVLGYLLTIAQLVPLFFAGIGIRDVSSIALLGTVGVGVDVAVAFATLVLALIIMMAILGGLLHLRAEGERGEPG